MKVLVVRIDEDINVVEYKFPMTVHTNDGDVVVNSVEDLNNLLCKEFYPSQFDISVDESYVTKELDLEHD